MGLVIRWMGGTELDRISGALLGSGLESLLREMLGGRAYQEAVECFLGHVGPSK